MFKHVLRLMLLVAIALPTASQAQTLDEYTFATGTNASLWINVPSTATQLIGASAGDDSASPVTDLGFSFPFGENVYTQFSVNTDGNLRLGNTATGTNAYSNPFGSGTATTNAPKINYFACDGYSSTGHYVRYLHTQASNGDSVGVVEFCLGTYNTVTRSNLYKWQVQLFHNGTVQIVIGEAPAAAPYVTRQPGLCVNAQSGYVINNAHEAVYFTNGTSTTIPTGTYSKGSPSGGPFVFIGLFVLLLSCWRMVVSATYKHEANSLTPFNLNVIEN